MNTRCNPIFAVACVALMSLLGAKAKGEPLNRSKPQPLGTLIDVGGYRVHLYCIGRGSPTVMIVGAAFSFDWDLVQPEVAKFTRVCTFDPSGTAWSDPFRTAINVFSSDASVETSALKSMPTCNDRVDEIHRLITNTPIDGPYVLVGFSVGALWERLYAARYPSGIVGMVIVDHSFLADGGSGTPSRPRDAASSPRGYVPPVLVSKAPIVIGFEDDLNFRKLPQRDQELHLWALSQHPVRPNYEMAADCFSLISSVTAQRTYPLGSTHLVVISTPNQAPGYNELQSQLLALSHRSEQVVAMNSSHMVPIDEPELITRTIRKVVDYGRRQGLVSRKP